MSQFAGPDYKCAEYDAVITAYFPDIQTLVGLKNDPRFKAEVSPDHKNFADEKRSGYVTLLEFMKISANVMIV